MKSSLQRSFAWRSFFLTIFFSTVLFLLLAYFCFKSQVLLIPMTVLEYAALFAFLVLYGILTWMFQKNILVKLLAGRNDPPKTPKTASPVPKPDEQQQARQQNHEKRLFIHLFAVLQREGRLLDFLQEDLSLYEDGQIGAAVRSIHENCKKNHGSLSDPRTGYGNRRRRYR